MGSDGGDKVICSCLLLQGNVASPPPKPQPHTPLPPLPASLPSGAAVLDVVSERPRRGCWKADGGSGEGGEAGSAAGGTAAAKGPKEAAPPAPDPRHPAPVCEADDGGDDDGRVVSALPAVKAAADRRIPSVPEPMVVAPPPARASAASSTPPARSGRLWRDAAVSRARGRPATAPAPGPASPPPPRRSEREWVDPSDDEDDDDDADAPRAAAPYVYDDDGPAACC